ncbi:MAG: methyltransferase [Actinobacteria bacterium 13_2_20CM_2_71_6]|nr:MAG: methyltransferase [Actinobacteria bacterium 13_2_20CM_2_71_6]
MTTTNALADWDRWPVADYLAENYRVLHPSDDAVLVHHSAFYRRFAPGELAATLEFGAGPNLYPLMLAAAASQRIDAVERSAANVRYLAGQLRAGPDPSWAPFYARCRELNPALPPDLTEALSRVRAIEADARDVPPGGYDAASMNFVAESVTEDAEEFAGFCAAFVRSVRPGGHLVAAFMENMASYRLGDGSRWPAYPVDAGAVRAAFTPYVAELTVRRIDADPTLPDYGYTGMLLLTALRSK